MAARILTHVHRGWTTFEVCDVCAAALLRRPGWGTGPAPGSTITPEEQRSLATEAAYLALGCMLCAGERTIEQLEAFATPERDGA